MNILKSIMKYRLDNGSGITHRVRTNGQGKWVNACGAEPVGSTVTTDRRTRDNAVLCKRCFS